MQNNSASRLALTALFIAVSAMVLKPQLAKPDSSPTDATAQGSPENQNSSPAVKQVRLIPLKSSIFDEIKEIIEPFLSSSGRIAHVSARNAVLIYDLPENIRQVKEVLEEIDPPPLNIRISVTFDETTEGGSAEAGISTGGIVISRTSRGKARVSGDIFVTGDIRSRSGRSETTQFLMTRNNRPARIWAGKTVASPVWIFEYGISRGWWKSEVVYQDIGASLWIHPRIIGDNQISVEVYPKITIEGTTPLSIEAQELSTQVVVSDGGIIQLGGLDQDKREAYRRLFGIGHVFDGRRLAITLHAEIIRP